MDMWVWITITLGALVVILGVVGIVWRSKDQREQDARDDEAQARLDAGTPPPRRTGTAPDPDRYGAASDVEGPAPERVTRRDTGRRPSSRVAGSRWEDRHDVPLFDPTHPLSPANPVNQSTYHPGYGGGHFHRPVEDTPARHDDPAPARHDGGTTPDGARTTSDDAPTTAPIPTTTPDPTPSPAAPSTPSYDYGGSSGSSSTGSDSGGGYGGSSGSSDSGSSYSSSSDGGGSY